MKKYECPACEKCPEWDPEEGCTFTGICEEPADPEFLRKENQMIYGERDPEEWL